MAEPAFRPPRPARARLARAAAALAVVGTSCSWSVVLPAPGAAAAQTRDITSEVLAGANVALTGDSVITLPPGTTTYRGVFSGQGTLTVAGSGTLVLTQDSDFTLPGAAQRQRVTTSGGNWPYPIVADPDPPAVVVQRGATLQYGDGGSTGIIGDYPYSSIHGLTLNHDNIEVDGTLVLDISGREFNLGTLSGSGTVTQPANTWGTLDLADDLPFTGTIGDSTGMNFGSAAFRLSLPSAAAVDNDGSAILSARDYTMVLPEDFYESRYGTDINFHTWQAGLIEMAGVDHYIDPSLDTASVAHTANFRGINIEGANVQWGDGRTDRFFLPATPSDSYINIHRDGSLTFDYDGPVTLDTPISGGVYHASLSTPADAQITLAPTEGNAVTFAVPMNYHGTTTIGRGATLLLGTGAAGGDGSLLTGAANDRIVDDGLLTVRDTALAVTLAEISGPGGLTQAGPATTTLLGTTGYLGPTTVSGGTLALGAGAGGIAQSSGLSLTAPGAAFDVSAAGPDQSVRQVTGVAGSTVRLGRTTLTVATSGVAAFAGSLTGSGGGVTTTGPGTWDLTGRSATPGGEWRLTQGTLALGPGAGVTVGSLTQSAGNTLSFDPAGGSAAASAAPIQASGAIRLAGRLAVTGAPPVAEGGEVVLIHNVGGQPISGQFAGLPQGAELSAGGRRFTIDYAADGTHDVALRATSAAIGPSAGPDAKATSADAANAGDGSPIGGLGPELAALGVAALLAAGGAFLVVKRRKHAASPSTGHGGTGGTGGGPSGARHRRGGR